MATKFTLKGMALPVQTLKCYIRKESENLEKHKKKMLDENRKHKLSKSHLSKGYHEILIQSTEKKIV